MGVVTVHEELKQAIDTLTDDQAAALLSVVRVMQPAGSDVELSDNWIERAHAFRRRLEQRRGIFPDVVETLDQLWEERLDDIDGVH